MFRWGACLLALVALLLHNASAFEFLTDVFITAEDETQVRRKKHHHDHQPGTPDETEDPAFAGWVAVAVALVSFGSFGVPIKGEAVQQAKVHPLVFQSYKTFWVFCSAWVVLAWEDLHVSPWGLLSGLFWVPSGIASIISVNNVGLAVGQATWQVTMVIVSFIWGCVGFHEHIKHPGQALVAVALLIAGLLGMTYVAGKGAQPAKQEDGEQDSLLESQKGPSKTVRGGPAAQMRFGLMAALFVGLWGGSNLVPMKFAHLGGPRYVVSFAIGSAAVNILLWVGYVGYLFMQAPHESVWKRLPSMHFGVMAKAGTIAGLLWSVGNYSAMMAIKELGQAIGYSCIQASIFISGLWGILLYGEVRGHDIVHWLISAVVALSGVILLAEQKA